jgi:hypothetical protein
MRKHGRVIYKIYEGPSEANPGGLGVLTWMFGQGSDGAVPVTARRAKRENGGLGEDPPGSTMTY